jgi:hypothetical protein
MTGSAWGPAFDTAFGGTGLPVLVTPAELRSALDMPASLVPDADLEVICRAVDEAVLPLLTTADHSGHHNCREAGLGIAVQVWQSRHSPGGQMVGVDLQPQATPHLLGPGLVPRFYGVLGPCLAYGGGVVS